ncbi:bifunctional DNA primase/polymerase [Streptomyces sp. AA0539]|uniref:bifunctional DNA primase/polymerase n=1 Tax=Streptomyces sp. AA0539 TaxID=1210045 RepID=UPI0002DACDC9|nr:bifunctional DNA primase/polymerase [Streptomyces sp. AA0539]
MTSDPRPALRLAALAAAECGWPVFPLRPGDKRPTGHREADCPRTGRCTDAHQTPEQRATTDRALIERCWQHAPYNIGIATGPANLVVIDLDLPKDDTDTPPAEWAQPGVYDGADVLALLAEQHGQPMPVNTRTVRTRRGGLHLYFTAPSGKTLRSSGGRLGWKVDVRAWGGYVVGPHSMVGGRPYTVLNPRLPAPLPAWLGDLIAPPAAPRPTARTVLERRVVHANAYTAKALHGELEKVLSAGEGGRNRAVYMAAFSLARFVASGDLSEQAVAEALIDAGCATGLPPGECRTAIRSGLTRGSQRAAGRPAAATAVGASNGRRPKAALSISDPQQSTIPTPGSRSAA